MLVFCNGIIEMVWPLMVTENGSVVGAFLNCSDLAVIGIRTVWAMVAEKASEVSG